METPNWELPETMGFSIPFCPKHLKFSPLVEREKFRRNVDIKFLKAIQPYLNEYVDKHTLFFLKGTGNNSRIEYQNNKIRYLKTLNSAIPEWEYPNDANTIANYNFNETTGTTSKDETGVYTLSDGGAPTRNVEGKVLSPAISLDGTDDFLYNGTLFDTCPPNGTIEYWYQPTHNMPSEMDEIVETLFAKVEGAQLIETNIQTDGVLYFSFLSSGWKQAATTQTSWVSGTWYHIANTWGSTGMKNIINGVVDGTNAYTGTFTSGTTNDFLIGTYPGPVYYLHAKLDLFRISNIQRTQFGGICPSSIF